MLRKLSTIASLSGLVALSSFGILSNAQNAESGVSKAITEPRRSESKEEFKPHVGVVAGFNDLSAGLRENAVEYGINTGFQPIIPFGIVFELTHLTAPSDRQDDLERTKLMAYANYNFGGTIPVLRHSYVGVGVGPVFDEVDERWDIEPGMAPVAGFDIPIATDGSTPARYTLGANANYLVVGGSNPDAFALNGQMKYWF